MTATADRYAGPLLGSANRLRLAVFAPNMAGGANLTRAPEAPKATWTESVEIARAAERAGFEAIIPVGRWRGMADPGRRAAHRSFESLTWAAGIAAVTSRIQVFATFHVPVTHPVSAAKQIATVDHIAGGRFAVNVVAGWNGDELRMFGLDGAGHDDRYAVADEWMAFLKRIWAAEEEFDFDGTYFKARGVLSEPKPVQRGRPVVMNAGYGPAGRAFAACHADLTFALPPDAEAAAKIVPELKADAARLHGRDLKVFAAAHVVCADTEDEARRAYARMVGESADRQAAERALRLLLPNPPFAGPEAEALAASAVAGFFALPLVGTPETIAEQMADLAEAGLDGLALSWLDYREGIARYARDLRPRLIARGLRER
ncbi:LLM class flavin-dependent oxidoreductase [Actinocorallia sp. A-T 12471]|uniref:LLM class flavin-dependent oxidoreductase n=1 Tax=Actinocorallia sp. A-T 12471 TaxID=3089813 RepID=UPI0029D1013C|nr:LLM class flavin-dependent oxidoreductase [Actinocorallia sp. A-T 12471]MDX6742404.1 LLM class flavin-dependent oxidoreductase [Actinocorallia sp. A-T 12471]